MINDPPSLHGGSWGGKKILTLNLDRWKKYFREKNYIENYFYLLKSTKSTKTTSEKCWRNIIWANFLGCPYPTNSIKTCLGLLVFLFFGKGAGVQTTYSETWKYFEQYSQDHLSGIYKNKNLYLFRVRAKESVFLSLQYVVHSLTKK